MNFTLYGFDLCAAYTNVEINQIKKKVCEFRGKAPYLVFN